VRFYVLSPERAPGCAGVSRPDGGNHQSVVIQIRYGETAILLAGDAEAEEESRMVEQFGGMLRSDALKVAHHGAATGTTAGFPRQVVPSIAVLSVGRENRYSHPSDSVVHRLMSTVETVLRTDRDGAVMLESDGRTVRVVPWRGDDSGD
jgi:competence protein ComEC